MKEREISLIDLIFDILLRWRVIVAAMLIGAIVLAGFGYLQSYRSYEAQVAEVEAAKKQVEEELEEIADEEEMPELDQITKKWLENKLTDTQLQNMQSVLLYEQMYEEKLAYMDEAVWMQADSDLVYKTELTFKVTAADTERSNAIERVYEDAAVSGELKERLADKLGASTDVVGDIYGLARGTGSLAEGGDTFRVSVTHYNKATCDKLADEVAAFLDEKCEAFQETLGSHEITVVNQSEAELTDSSLLNYQNQYYRDLMSLQSTITGLKDAFTIYELQYYDILTNGKFTELTEDAVAEIEEAEEEAAEAEAIAAAAEGAEETPADIVARGVTVTPGISLKYIILGMILGAFVLVFWYFVVYIMNGKLRATDNLQDLYDIPQLGQIKGTAAGKKLFGFVDQWIISLRDYNKRKFTEAEAVELAAVAVKMAAGKAKLDTVYIIGCDLKGRSMELSERLKARLAGEDIHVEVLSNVIYDAQAMNDLEHAQGVVLLETAGSTLYSEIAQELELLGRQGIRVLGGILVE